MRKTQRQSRACDERAAGEQAGRGADAGQRGPRAQRLRALATAGERREEDRQGGGRQERTGETLDAARGDEDAGAGREAADRRRRRERRERGQEHAAPSEEVGGLAAEEQEPAEREEVGVGDPGRARSPRSPRSAWMEGSATFTIVSSTSSMNCPRQTRTRICRRRSFGGGGDIGGLSPTFDEGSSPYVELSSPSRQGGLPHFPHGGPVQARDRPTHGAPRRGAARHRHPRAARGDAPRRRDRGRRPAWVGHVLLRQPRRAAGRRRGAHARARRGPRGGDGAAAGHGVRDVGPATP